jgi:predicted ATP-dependent endonuclease of OLD family
VTFFIKDKGKEHPFKPEERSKGLQWYLAFFARLKAQGVTKNNIILVDEPGSYLHAKAQEDVLHTLEELADDNQVIFTTHSPYLIDPDKFERVRLVIKDKETEYTRIENNVNKGGDYETLTPLITAIGLDLSKGLSFAKKSNIVLEGISDYYYIQAMKHYLKENEGYEFPDDVAFIPCVGQSKVGAVTSILFGYGLDYKIVLDKKGTTKNYNKLIRDGIDTNKIIRVGDTDDQSIEDLFSEEDLDKYQLKSDQPDSKTIISKRFYQAIETGEYKGFSKKTLDNFRTLLDSIKKDLQ